MSGLRPSPWTGDYTAELRVSLFSNSLHLEGRHPVSPSQAKHDEYCWLLLSEVPIVLLNFTWMLKK